MTTDEQILETVKMLLSAKRMGKQVQFYHVADLDWVALNVDTISMRDLERFKFRIKPEPRKPRDWNVEVDRNGNITGPWSNQAYREIVHVREVLPE